MVNNLINLEMEDFEKFSKIGWSFTNISSHLKKNNNLSIGYINNSKLYGVLIGEKLINNFEYNLDIHIMFVSKKLRKKNVGSKMLNFIEKNKKTLKISEIYLEVSEDNIGAIKFYEKNNFVFFKIRHNYYTYNKKIFNAKCYYKKI